MIYSLAQFVVSQCRMKRGKSRKYYGKLNILGYCLEMFVGLLLTISIFLCFGISEVGQKKIPLSQDSLWK